MSDSSCILVVDEVYQKLEKLAVTLRSLGKHRQADLIMFAGERYLYDTVLDRNGKSKPNDSFVRAIELLERIPVTIEEFLDSPEFMGGERFDIYPKVKERLLEMKLDPFSVSRSRPHISEIYLGGAIGTSKSQTSIVGCLYDAHWWCCFKTPWKLFEGEGFKMVGISFQSRRELTAKKTLFEPFKNRMLAIPWFKDNFKINATEKEITIPEKKLRAFYTVGNADGAIGEDILSGIIDEVNFYEVINESKKAQGASYDAGKDTVNTLVNRRRSRYPSSNAFSFGSIYIISSANYCDDLIDRKAKSYDKEKEPHVYLKIDKHWDIVPINKVNPSGERFPFLLGNETYAGKILTEDAVRGVDYPDDGIVEMVPIEFKANFLDDPDQAQLDYIGVASSAVTRFIGNPAKIDLAIEMFAASGNQVFVNEQNTLLHQHGLPIIIPERLPLDKDTERYIHVDLSRTKDRCGVAMVKINDWVYKDIENSNGTISERLPVYDVELAISIQPSGAYELQISQVRQWIQTLKNTYGLNIKAVTYDGQTGFESIELLRKSGIQAHTASVDRSTEAYDTLKEALYDQRLILPPNDLLSEELAHLKLIKRGQHSKVDHDTNFSKDISDAVAGAILLAKNNRGNLHKHDIKINGIERRSANRRSFKGHRKRRQRR